MHYSFGCSVAICTPTKLQLFIPFVKMWHHKSLRSIILVPIIIFPSQDLQLFQWCHMVWADNPKFYNLRSNVLRFQHCCTDPKKSIHLSGKSIEAFCFSFAPCHWGEILPFTPSFLASDALSFSFSFWWLDKPLAPPIKVSVAEGWQDMRVYSWTKKLKKLVNMEECAA